MRAATRGAVAELQEVADASRLPGMARVGINVDRAIGVSVPNLRRLGRRLGPDHALALDLWRTGIHEARILASMVDDPAQVTRDQMEDWVLDFDSWDLCDQVVGNLFELTSFPASVPRAWTKRSEEFVKRAGFALIAARAVRDRSAPDRTFIAWFPAIRHGATDDRNYVKKAVSWALRQIGKRNLELNTAAIAEAETLSEHGVPSARWVGRDALRELRLDETQRRLRKG
ncbi:MAG: DNA alkylation repair protein [Actinomycetota bacterium]